jgi:uncharacterized membrane protein
MRKRHRLVALIFAAVIFALAIPAARPQTAPAPLNVPAGFDLAFAMNALYGNYDSAAGTSSSTAPMSGLEYTNFQAGQKVNVKAFFAAADSSTGEVFLATFAVPAEGEFDCHACAPLIGAAVFEKSGTSWKMEASEKPDIIFGQYGNPATAQLFQVGPSHSGIQLSDTDGGQGVADSHVIFLVSWNGGFSQAYSGIVASNNSDYCGAQAGSPCYAYHSDLKFVKGDDPDYYDLTIETSGTNLPTSGTGGIENMSGVQHLRLVDGKYVAANAK